MPQFSEVLLNSFIDGLQDGFGNFDLGPGYPVTRTRTSSADLSAGAFVSAAPGTGKKVVITDLLVSAAVDMTLTFTEETTDTVIYKLFLSANTVVQVTLRSSDVLPTAGKRLKATASVAGNVFISCHQTDGV